MLFLVLIVNAAAVDNTWMFDATTGEYVESILSVRKVSQ